MSNHARGRTVHEKKKRHVRPEEQPPRRKKGWAIAAVAVLSVMAVVSATLGVLRCQFNYNYVDLKNFSDAELGINKNSVSQSEDVINIALFGLDTRRADSFKGNSDTIMVLSIDKVHNKIKLISIMRDSLVNIENYRYPAYKINAAYAKGGPTLAINTINRNFNLDIREYVTVNFNGMAKIIDKLGGITANVTKAEVKDANIHIKYQARRINVEPDYITHEGEQQLNGLQAVAWARIRHVKTADGVSNDFGRTDRQRYVLECLFNKLLATDKSQYPSLIHTMLPYVETSLSYADLIGLAGVLSQTGLNFEQARIPQMKMLISGGFTVHGASTVYYNLDYATKVIHAFIYDDIKPKDYMEQNEVDKTPWYQS